MRHLLALSCLLIFGCAQNSVEEPVRGEAIGRGLYTVHEFYSAPEMNLIYDLAIRKPGSGVAGEYVVAACDGYRVISESGSELRFRRWPGGSADGATILFDVGETGFVIRQHDKLVRVDWHGNRVWRAHVEGIGNALVLDSAGAEPPLIVCGYDLDVLGARGRRLRKLPHGGGSFCSAVLRAAPDQESVVAANVVGGWFSGAWSVQIIDRRGNVRSSWSPGFDYYAFTTPRLADGPGDELLFLRDESIETRDLDGKLRSTYDAPGARHFAIPLARRLGTDAHDRSMIVLAASKGGSHVHGVYVYASDGALRYCRIGDDDAKALLLVQSAGEAGALPSFLVGTRGKVLKFTPTQ